MADHDGGYKSLFSNQRMVEDLLRGFVDEPWVERLDFSTLEPCEGSYVAEDYRRFEQDMVWRVRWRSFEDRESGSAPWLFVYLLLEFQSRSERFMALRMLTYVSLFYQDLLKRRELTPSGKLPPILPLVLYNGPTRWSAPREVGDLIEEIPGGLTAYRPSLRYLLLDEGEHTGVGRAGSGNLAAALFRLEHSRDLREVEQIIETLAELLDPRQDQALRRAFGTWLTEILAKARFPAGEHLETRSLEESRDMLKERVVEWTREWERQGLEKGLQEGMRKGMRRGRREGEQRMLVRLLERKFGALDAEARRRIEAAGDEELLAWSEKLLSAERLEEVFR